MEHTFTLENVIDDLFNTKPSIDEITIEGYDDIMNDEESTEAQFAEEAMSNLKDAEMLNVMIGLKTIDISISEEGLVDNIKESSKKIWKAFVKAAQRLGQAIANLFKYMISFLNGPSIKAQEKFYKEYDKEITKILKTNTFSIATAIPIISIPELIKRVQLNHLIINGGLIEFEKIVQPAISSYKANINSSTGDVDLDDKIQSVRRDMNKSFQNKILTLGVNDVMKTRDNKIWLNEMFYGESEPNHIKDQMIMGNYIEKIGSMKQLTDSKYLKEFKKLNARNAVRNSFTLKTAKDLLSFTGSPRYGGARVVAQNKSQMATITHLKILVNNLMTMNGNQMSLVMTTFNFIIKIRSNAYNEFKNMVGHVGGNISKSVPNTTEKGLMVI